eukprot:911258-Pelagomonas_calceolata.AAC.1
MQIHIRLLSIIVSGPVPGKYKHRQHCFGKLEVSNKSQQTTLYRMGDQNIAPGGVIPKGKPIPHLCLWAGKARQIACLYAAT